MNEYDSSLKKVNEWILRTEGLVDSADGNCTFDELSVDEQLILWEDLEAELAENEQCYASAMADSATLIKHLKKGRKIYIYRVFAMVLTLTAFKFVV